MGKRGYCSIVNGGCLAPAALKAGGGLVDQPLRSVKTCSGCGDDVCGNPACSTLVRGKRLCASCIERAS